MLKLRLRKDQTLLIGDEIRIKVLSNTTHQALVEIIAPEQLNIRFAQKSRKEFTAHGQ